jgi:hypothetical protein
MGRPPMSVDATGAAIDTRGTDHNDLHLDSVMLAGVIPASRLRRREQDPQHVRITLADEHNETDSARGVQITR